MVHRVLSRQPDVCTGWARACRNPAAPKRFARKNLDEYPGDRQIHGRLGTRPSFFITREMDRQFRGQVTMDFSCPFWSYWSARATRSWAIDMSVETKPARSSSRAPDYKAPGVFGNKAVEIDFRTDDDQSLHKLIYFSVNLSGRTAEDQRPFLSFLSRLKGVATFFKATSYMVHKPEFSIIREQVLARSALILQDDSGIPYHWFSAPSGGAVVR